MSPSTHTGRAHPSLPRSSPPGSPASRYGTASRPCGLAACPERPASSTRPDEQDCSGECARLVGAGDWGRCPRCERRRMESCAARRAAVELGAGSSAFGEGRWWRWFAERAVLEGPDARAAKPSVADPRDVFAWGLDASSAGATCRRLRRGDRGVDDQVLLQLGAQALLGLCTRGDLIDCTSIAGVQISERALSAA